MSSQVKICDIDEELKKKIGKFRFRKEKNSAAIIMKINPETRMVILEEEYEDVTIEEVSEECHSSQPRYVLYSHVYKHDDGRVSYPMCFIFVSPPGGKPELNMMYAGSKLNLVAEAGLTKVFEVRSVEELTEEWLTEKLKFFK